MLPDRLRHNCRCVRVDTKPWAAADGRQIGTFLEGTTVAGTVGLQLDVRIDSATTLIVLFKRIGILTATEETNATKAQAHSFGLS